MAQCIDEKVLLDWGARIGAAAKSEGVKVSQLENLLASLDSFSDDKASLLGTAAFALRQAERLRSGRKMAKLVGKAMIELCEKGCGKNEARKILGFAKWVYEALGFHKVRDFENLTLEKLLDILLSS